MALKAAKNGQYEIKNEKQAVEALTLFQVRKAKAEALRIRHGIADMEKDCVELKKAVTAFAVSSDADRIDFDVDGKDFHATLVKQFHGAMFVATDEDIPDEFPDAKSLKSIIEEKFDGSIKEKGKARKVWNKITRRIADRSLIDQAVAEGLLTVDEIAPSFIEREKAPYLRIFEE
jgi:F0F1-type ATP synthase alpha subunit